LSRKGKIKEKKRRREEEEGRGEERGKTKRGERQTSICKESLEPKTCFGHNMSIKYHN